MYRLGVGLLGLFRWDFEAVGCSFGRDGVRYSLGGDGIDVLLWWNDKGPGTMTRRF